MKISAKERRKRLHGGKEINPKTMTVKGAKEELMIVANSL